MSTSLRGTAFITGAGSGIGAASARAFAISGVFKMSLVDIDRDALQSITSSLLGDFPGIDVLALPTDITDEKSVGNAVRETIARFSRIDYAVHAAGVGDVQLATDEIPVPEWQKMIDINLTGTWICERSVIQAMLQQESRGGRFGRGVIVNVASALGLTASVTAIPLPSYVAAKHGVLGFTKMDAKIYAPHDIRINAICPGWIHTNMTKVGIDSGMLSAEIQSIPIGRVGTVEEVADAIIFLSSPQSSYMYGSALVIDGGYSV